jgi:hypothetical protein
MEHNPNTNRAGEINQEQTRTKAFHNNKDQGKKGNGKNNK